VSLALKVGPAIVLLLGSLAAAGQVPPEVAASVGQWPLPNQNYASTRAASVSPIAASNVNDLAPAWSFAFPVNGFFGAVATNPLVVSDVVYFQDLQSNAYALDLQTGVPIWSHAYGAINFGPNGLAVGYGKVFLPKDPKTVAALDLGTGGELWAVDPTRTPSEGMTIQPLVYDGKLYLSTVPGTGVADFYSGNASGRIHALDVDDGSAVWDFDTVDTMHEMPPHIWGNTTLNSGGGAWYPPSIDTVRGTTYWGTGNPAPFAGTAAFPNGSSRPGPNLYTDSILALDHQTGALDWYQQAKAHDLTDGDFISSPILATVPIGGTPTDIAIGSGKLGVVYAYDRDTGAVLWSTPVGDHLNDTLDPLPAGSTLVLPGVLGGVETPMAYADGKVFVPVVNLGTSYDPTVDQVAFVNPNTGTGELVALDASDGSVAWSVSYPAIDIGAATVVNDLVFTATFDGEILAHRIADGAEVWRYSSGEPINSWPAVAGNTILFSTRSRMLAFRLAGPVPGVSLPAVGVLALAIVASASLLLTRGRQASR
jgi:outer membrane protein assembly factor BamB